MGLVFFFALRYTIDHRVFDTLILIIGWYSMEATMKITMKDTKQALAMHGINIKKTGYGQEMRVSYKGMLNTETSAYYTDNMLDAIYTGMRMSESRIA